MLAAQKKGNFATLDIDLSNLAADVPKEAVPYYVQAFCEGYWLAGYRFHDLKRDTPPDDKVSGLILSNVKATKEVEAAIQKARILSQSVCFSRSLGDRPGNHLTPPMMAKIVGEAARKKGLKCTVFDRKRIEKEKMGLLMGVGKGSVEEPRLIIMEHRKGKKNDAPIILVGKGITFDSGGISIKPSSKMEEMKYDMMGAATVAGVMLAVADLKLPLNIVGMIAAAENMPGGKAQKPGDVAYSMNGKSVEITNTDAEGRLVLADTLEYAQKMKPQAIIDFATLTGAVVVALGSCCTGVMGNSDELISRLKKSADVTGEKVWQLPLFEEYEDFLKSPVADIKNASDIREAGSQKGGTFLKFFIEKSLPWVHCDIAGSGMLRSDRNYIPRRYGAGVMVRLMAHALENWSPISKNA